MLKCQGYSDGSCKGNPGRGGWGCLLDVPCHDIVLRWMNCGGKDYTTNQEMELTGFLELLKMCSDTIESKEYKLHTDSTYVLEGLLGKGKKQGEIQKVFEGYVNGWIRNGWKTKAGTPVKHIALWKAIMEECKKIVLGGSILKCEWVKGHNGNEGNEMADKLAKMYTNDPPTFCSSPSL